MPALLRRARRERDPRPSESIASLIENLQTNAESRPAVSHREFREFIRERDRSHDEAWAPIRTAALTEGRR